VGCYHFVENCRHNDQRGAYATQGRLSKKTKNWAFTLEQQNLPKGTNHCSSLRLTVKEVLGMSNIFLFLALIGTASSFVYLVLAIVAALRYIREPRLQKPGTYTPISLLKPIHGDEPQLYENLLSHFHQSYPADYEVIFCARHFSDPAFRTVDRLAAEFPNRTVKKIACGEPLWINPRTFSVDRMIDIARYESVVITDSDVRVEDDFLENLTPELDQPGVGLVTCLYRGVPSGGPWSFLEAIGMSVEMSSGVLVANMLEGMKFALGPSMALHKSCIPEIGGLEDIASYYADDFVLGNRVANAGFKVFLSKNVVNHVVTNTKFARSLKHQLGWMRSTRFSRPMGHLGTALTFAMPFAILGFCVEAFKNDWRGAILFLSMGILNRMIQSIVVGWMVVKDRRSILFAWLYPVRDLMGFLFWAASYCSSKVGYRGETYILYDEGKIKKYVD
jgi:ceramide glucosyltransferase